MLENKRNQLFSIFLLTVLFFIFTALFVFLTDPFKLPVIFLIPFYLSLSAFVFFFSLLVLYGIRGRSLDGLYAHKLQISVRQAFWLTLLVTGTLILSSQQLFYWWLELIFILTLIMIEGFFLSN